MKVLELMKTHVIKASPEATLRDAVDMMDLYQISGLPVVDGEGRLVGVVTEHDVIESLLPHYAEVATHPTDHDPGYFGTLVERVRSKPIADAMPSPAISVDENADITEAAMIMLTRRIKRLPVTSQGHLVGILSRIDICQAVLDGQVLAA